MLGKGKHVEMDSTGGTGLCQTQGSRDTSAESIPTRLHETIRAANRREQNRGRSRAIPKRRNSDKQTHN